MTLAFLVPLGLLLATPAAHAQVPAPVPACTVTDPELGELSGLVADDEHWYAVNDGGTAATVYVLDRDCQVQDVLTAPLDPYDVEDLALGQDGTFWLSDTGDNDGDRDTVALIALTPAGETTLYRLTYPDGRHDAEALLLDPAGTPYIITKSPLGTAAVYRPAAPLTSPGPTPLQHVMTVRLSSTDTPGGPVPGVVGSVTVTGAAASRDGTAIALRTYTDAYLFPMKDGDVVGAFSSEPVRVPLPNEVQGEAIAFQPDGSLVSASEGVGQPVTVVAGAARLVAPKPPPETAKPEGAANISESPPDEEGLPVIPAAAVTIGVIVVVYLLFRLLRGRKSY
ncbi:hypothetical protein [Actinophytocola glycyrrhizae]|uniref:Esterase-like activity of phytase family protein n=1 Tax=Actinophytocola glycyrrhizae TaxID=2044873 RepID=A0ABV9S9U5_9PSEU